MSREMEDRLRAAYQAKTEQVTDRRLAQLRAERASQLATLLSEDVPIARLEHPPVVTLDSRRHRHSRWFAPAIAAAAVAAVAAAAFALSSSGSHRVLPAPPASHLSSPVGSASPSVSSTPSTSASSSTSIAPAYLPAGQTGARTDVPWAAVGAGWRLVQPMIADGAEASALYLYDPADGRYLITDQLPGPANLIAWSPDGQRAMFQSATSQLTRFQELDLHSGQLDSDFTQFGGNFVSYTQPRGLAAVVAGSVQGSYRLLRYGTDGTLQLPYPPTVDGLGPLASKVLYTADGGQFVSSAGTHPVLMTNGGQLVRSYPFARTDDGTCLPLRWWTSGTFLEFCDRLQAGKYLDSLYLQPVDGGTPAVLIDRNSQFGNGYDNAWPLSNGDVLLAAPAGCGVVNYDILRPDGSVVPLRRPSGVPDTAKIINMSGDVATFQVATGGTVCVDAKEITLIDYDMVTGKTSPLLDGRANVVNYPGD